MAVFLAVFSAFLGVSGSLGGQAPRSNYPKRLAERVGFEPTEGLPLHLISSQARSTELRHLSAIFLLPAEPRFQHNYATLAHELAAVPQLWMETTGVAMSVTRRHLAPLSVAHFTRFSSERAVARRVDGGPAWLNLASCYEHRARVASSLDTCGLRMLSPESSLALLAIQLRVTRYA